MATASPTPQVAISVPAIQATPVKPATPIKVTDKKSPKPKTQARRAIKPKVAGVGSHPPFGDMYVSASFIMNFSIF